MPVICSCVCGSFRIVAVLYHCIPPGIGKLGANCAGKVIGCSTRHASQPDDWPPVGAATLVALGWAAPAGGPGSTALEMLVALGGAPLGGIEAVAAAGRVGTPVLLLLEPQAIRLADNPKTSITTRILKK